MRHQRKLPLAAIFALFIVMVFAMCRKRSDEQIPVQRTPVEEVPVTIIEEHHSFTPVTEQINDAFGGYYVALPPRYEGREEKFPLLIFLHGLGQIGNGANELSYITFDGIGKLINDKKFPVSFAHDGKQQSFIVVSPQSNSQPGPAEVKQLADLMIERYRVDTQRVYLSGLSMGGRVVTLTAAEYPEFFAAIVPIAGVATGQGLAERCQKIAEANLPVWELHNADDPMADVAQARQFIETLIQFHPAVTPRFTIFDVYGHDAWTTALDPGFRENGRNIYEWMLQFSR